MNWDAADMAIRIQRKRASRRDVEHQQQCALIEWARLNETREPRLQLLYAIPNGGARSKAQAGRLKAEGVRAGVYDLCLACPGMLAGQVYHALYLEMKTDVGKLSGAQEQFLTVAGAYGNACRMHRDWVEAARLIIAYLGAEKHLSV